MVGPYFDKLGPLRDGLALARREQRSGKLLGYIDLSGRYVIPPEFGWADDFSEGRALVRREGLLEFIDTRGTTMTLFGLICGEVVVFDAQGRLTWPREKLTCPDAGDLEYAPAPESAQAQ
ncbi:WG repeat-containing protein [Achromobacter ruhlandii]|uniref:WG repeat-containing protein n=1 Tax=Achromobacter ruhlandii TaxID=72557 RepID=UPI003BA2D7E5